MVTLICYDDQHNEAARYEAQDVLSLFFQIGGLLNDQPELAGVHGMLFDLKNQAPGVYSIGPHYDLVITAPES